MIGPSPSTPARRPGSVRRTSSVDILIDAGDGLLLRGAARDLLSTLDGEAWVLAAAAMRARIGPDRRLEQLSTTRPEPAARALLGRPVGSGFRAAMSRCLPHHADEGTALHLLLDDIPVAALIGGYALRYAHDRDGGPAPPGALPIADICVGWRSDGPTMRALRETGHLPPTVGPPAPELTPAWDPLAWHALDPLPPRAMRRRRRIDVAGGDPVAVEAMFRDTHVDDTGVERIIHEYALTAFIDTRSGELRGIEATPRVLPFPDCPVAAGTAATASGHAVHLLRNYVDQALFGPATCTHLNDLLRSLGDAGRLARSLIR